MVTAVEARLQCCFCLSALLIALHFIHEGILEEALYAIHLDFFTYLGREVRHIFACHACLIIGCCALEKLSYLRKVLHVVIKFVVFLDLDILDFIAIIHSVESDDALR